MILDIGLPDQSGLDVLEQIRGSQPAPPVLVVTAHGNLQNAVEARKGGAAGYLVKPLDLAELERTLLAQLHGKSPMRWASATTPFGSISRRSIGCSAWPAASSWCVR